MAADKANMADASLPREPFPDDPEELRDLVGPGGYEARSTPPGGSRHLKGLIKAGGYEADPAGIADAMLRRRGVRELLCLGLGAPMRADRIRAGSSQRHRAA